MLKKILYINLSLLLIVIACSGCNTFKPEHEDSVQPWAQPESWEQTRGVPGFSGHQLDDFS